MGSGNYTVKTNKIPLPTLAPDDYSSGVFCISLSPEWYWIVQGLTEMLNIRALWKWTNDEEWKQIQEWLARLAALERDCMPDNCCPMRFNIELGTIQIFSDGAWVDIEGTENLLSGGSITKDTTTNVYELTFNQGGDEISFDIDVSETNIYNTPPVDPSKTDDERACAIATHLIEWAMETYNDMLDAIEATTDTVGALDSLTAIIPPLYLVIDTVTDVIVEVVEATTGYARGLDTFSLRQGLSDELYCRIVNNDYQFTLNLWKIFEEDVIASTTPSLIAAWLKGALKDEGILDQANRASYGTSTDCSSVDCNCAYFLSLDQSGIGYRADKYGTPADFSNVSPQLLFQEKHGKLLSLEEGKWETDKGGAVTISGAVTCFSELGALYTFSKPVDIDKLVWKGMLITSPLRARDNISFTVWGAGWNTNWKRMLNQGYTHNDFNGTERTTNNFVGGTNISLMLVSISIGASSTSTQSVCDDRYATYQFQPISVHARLAGVGGLYPIRLLNERWCT